MPWTCPNCDRELKKEGQTHYCVKVSVDELFAGKKQDLVLVFDKILAEVADWEDVLVNTTPNCIVFVHRQTFLVVKPMSKVLDVKFYSPTPLDMSQIYKNVVYLNRYVNHVRLSATDEVSTPLFQLIRGSYQLL